MMAKILHLGATPSVVYAAGAGAVAVLLALPLADRLPMPVVLWSLLLGALLLHATVVDLRYCRIPDLTSGAVVLAGCGFLMIWMPDRILLHVAGSLVSSLAIFVVAGAIAQFLGQAALGGGDVKLVGAVALWLGPELVAQTMAIAAWCALFVILVVRILRRRREDQLPAGIAFGPYIALGTWVSWLYGPVL